jgi:tetratricopeptide (TPR) repeat protein
METLRKIDLPRAPGGETGSVKAWIDPVVIPTYEPMPPDRNPMFLETRVYQGSSGEVYPLPFIDRISTERRDRAWQAVHLENEYLRLVVLPEIGGRIHVGLDKTNGYDFFYRQNVIKPALVGLAGPWISGGVEFNWPQHHRPATFMPVHFEIEEHEDGSKTIWCGDHDPMNRMNGMHGVCLYPGRAYVEVKVRLYNRTQFTQTFLWWANAATRVHEKYESVFPADVRFVVDHAKRAMSEFPLCSGHYYGVDYGGRATNGVPLEERPKMFAPPGDYPPNDLSWYANIPVPTSYMAVGSKEDFFGGYDHAREAGVIHVANHRIAPGKKQWTWGNHDFGYAWDRNLTDADGPYIELMAGVYTDNQPDFSFLAPGETKTFSQYWYPIQRIGPPQKASIDAAIRLTQQGGELRAGICVTRPAKGANIRFDWHGKVFAQRSRDLIPGEPAIENVAVPEGTPGTEVGITVTTREGRKLVSFEPEAEGRMEMPAPAAEPPPPKKAKSLEDLYLTGLHLEQYRHATRYPEPYWREALRRDSDDSRSNNATGLWHLRRGEFVEAKERFERAIAKVTQYNSNPRDGEPYYNLGLTLCYLGEEDRAYAVFYKAAWSYAWRSASYHAIAELDARRCEWEMALEHLKLALRTNADLLAARNLAALVLRRLRREAEAEKMIRGTLELNPLDFWAKQLAGDELQCDNQIRLDIAFDCARAGFYDEASQILGRADYEVEDGSVPIILYALAYCRSQLNDHTEAQNFFRRASEADPKYCFPSRLDELIVLERALEVNPADGRAAYYLGNLLYDRRRHREAISLWERAARLHPEFPTVWRNLGISYFNVFGDAGKSRSAFEEAFRADPNDARVLYERDQLWKRTSTKPWDRLKELEDHLELVDLRDDLSVELAALYNLTDQPEKARALLTTRAFQPWEGGEGLALGQHVRTHLALGRRALLDGRTQEAIGYFKAALTSPQNLGEAKHLLANQSNIHYWLGFAYQVIGEEELARNWWLKAASKTEDFQEMSVKRFSEMTYYTAMALKRLGEEAKAQELFDKLLVYAKQLARQRAEIDYFATSLPMLLLFHEDLEKRKNLAAAFLEAQAALGQGRKRRATQLLTRILETDPNHSLASDLQREITCETRLREPVPAAV